MMRGISDSAYILPAEVDSETGVAVTNYGLNNNAFRKLSGPGWMGYNRSYLPLPEKMAGTNFSMTFTDVDGTTDTIGYEDKYERRYVTTTQSVHAVTRLRPRELMARILFNI